VNSGRAISPVSFLVKEARGKKLRTPLSANCTPMATTTNPMNRVGANLPRNLAIPIHDSTPPPATQMLAVAGFLKFRNAGLT
jgi:hypothetical protein